MRKEKYIRLLLVMVAILLFAASTIAAASQATQYNPLGVKSTENMMPNGEYEIYVFTQEKWQQAGKIAFDKSFSERELDLSSFLSNSKEVKVKLVQKGGGAAHIDSVLLGGISPVAVEGVQDGLKKLSKKDFDAADAFGKEILITFPEKSQDSVLKLTARVENSVISKTPFQFPTANLYKKMDTNSQFYHYKMNTENTLSPFFKEYSLTGSGHPSGYTYGWVKNDDKNLYVKIDFTPDNTMDGDKDYAKVYVKTKAGLKEFKVSVPETKWGTPDFTYTDKVSYEHKVYDFTIPVKELGISDVKEEKELLLAFAAYGTAVPIQCGDPVTLIHDIQGNGLTSPLVGTQVAIEAIVVGDFQNNATPDNGNLNGFFIQEEDADADANPLTSEGIFVSTSLPVDVSVGDKVRVQGTVTEFNGLTEISSVTVLLPCSTGNSLPTAALVNMPVTSLDDFERYEGMAVTLPQELYISEYFNFDRFGEVLLTAARQFQPTAIYEPGSLQAANLASANSLSRITLDDGRDTQNPDPAIHPNGSEFDLLNLFRGGDTVQNVTGVMGYERGLYRVQPTQGADYTSTNPRTAQPDDVGGNLKVASFNTFNYFTTLDNGSSICGPLLNQPCRGADDATEFTRQRDKIIAALTAIDADIVGLSEIENYPGDIPTADLVSGLNDVMGSGTYNYIATVAIGSDAIRNALIYKTATVSPVGNYAVLNSSVDPRFLDNYSRPTLAQTFQNNATLGTFTVAMNHLKSKGSTCDAVGDPDLGDGAGNCNLTREAAVEALVDWLASDPTGSGDIDFLIIGDLNSYDKEDPIDSIKAGADDILGTGDDYADLIFQFIGEQAYSYLFDGQLGYLDHALANASLTNQVTGVTIWHINADEPDLIDYDMTFKGPNQDAIYVPDAYRTSDHDPVIIGLNIACDVNLSITKVTADGATQGDGLNVLTGETIGWKYTVTNTGIVALSNVTVSDSEGVAVTCPKTTLAVLESMTCTATGTAVTGNYSNVGTASGSCTEGGYSQTNTATDASSYFGADPQIAITKVTVDGATSGDSLNILTGETIGWKYTVTNTGNVTLCNVSVTDSKGVAVTCPKTTLAVGESMTCNASGTASTGNYSNTGTASGSFTDSAGHSRADTDSDASSFFGANPQIEIVKKTVGSDGSEGDNVFVLLNGSVTWKYYVTNTGNVALSNVTVTDNKGVTVTCPKTTLAVGESMTCTATGTNSTTAGTWYSNTGTATGSYTDSGGHSRTSTDSDNSGYYSQNPGMVTNSSLCDFGTDFTLVFTPDIKNYSSSQQAYKLSDSNPGQFFYNVFQAGGSGSVTLTVPYPFVTQGATPIHVYSSLTAYNSNGKTCLRPTGEIKDYNTQVTLSNYPSNNYGSTTSVTMTGLPTSGFMYINIHLDYGLEKLNGWIKNNTNANYNLAINPTMPKVNIINNTIHNFTSTIPNSADSIYNNNEFKKIKGFGGLVTIKTGSVDGVDQYAGLQGAKVQLRKGNQLIETMTTDVNGWYLSNYIHSGKDSTYTINVLANTGNVAGTTYGYSIQTNSITLGKSVKYGEGNFQIVP